VEEMEGRDNPSPLWTDASGDHQFANPLNWDTGLVPGANDYVVFRGSNGGSGDDCYGMHGVFFGVSLEADYGGTITLTGATNISYYFFMASGKIDQPASGDDLNVTTYFYWYGGTLNSTTNLANVNISAATAEIGPGQYGGSNPVSIGSNLNFTNGTVGTLDPGTVNFTNAGAVNIDATSEVDAKPTTITSTVKYVGVYQINLAAGGKFFVGGPGTFDGTGVPFYNNGGYVWLYDSATVKLGGSVKVGTSTYPSSYYQDGSGALTDIQSGSVLNVAKDVFLTDGLFKTSWNPNLADNVTAQTGTVTGDFTVTGGVVSVNEGGAAKHYGTFYVSGTVLMNGGTYKPVIDGTTSGTNDHWESGGNFLLDQIPGTGGTATLTPLNSAGAGTVANGVWKIIKARGTNTITGSFATTNLQYFAGPPAKSYTWATFGTPINEAGLTT
jgi:hypothetical protein